MEINLKGGSRLILDRKKITSSNPNGQITLYNSQDEFVLTRPATGTEILLMETIEELYEMYDSWQKDRPAYEFDNDYLDKGTEPQ